MNGKNDGKIETLNNLLSSMGSKWMELDNQGITNKTINYAFQKFHQEIKLQVDILIAENDPIQEVE